MASSDGSNGGGSDGRYSSRSEGSYTSGAYSDHHDGSVGSGSDSQGAFVTTVEGGSESRASSAWARPQAGSSPGDTRSPSPVPAGDDLLAALGRTDGVGVVMAPEAKRRREPLAAAGGGGLNGGERYETDADGREVLVFSKADDDVYMAAGAGVAGAGVAGTATADALATDGPRRKQAAGGDQAQRRRSRSRVSSTSGAASRYASRSRPPPERRSAASGGDLSGSSLFGSDNGHDPHADSSVERLSGWQRGFRSPVDVNPRVLVVSSPAEHAFLRRFQSDLGGKVKLIAERCEAMASKAPARYARTLTYRQLRKVLDGVAGGGSGGDGGSASNGSRSGASSRASNGSSSGGFLGASEAATLFSIFDRGCRGRVSVSDLLAFLASGPELLAAGSGGDEPGRTDAN